MQKLTSMQQQIYDFIKHTIHTKGYAPTVREIGEAVGLKSPSTVHFHLGNLEAMGCIERSAGKGRTITLPEEEHRSIERIPIVGNVAAGTPILAQQNIEDYLTFDAGGDAEEFFALRVRGESMIDAGILSGDVVVVHRQPEVNNGEIAVALLDNEATVKRFSRHGNSIWLLPENENYQPIDGRHAEILGRVTAVVRRY